jgi:hypothetical protein
MPKQKPVTPASSEDALSFVHQVEQRLGPARLKEMSDEQIERELLQLAGSREELDAIKRRIMMDIFKRPQPKSEKR